MPFERSQFDGLSFDWYGVDETDSIAVFTAGFAAIPSNVFSSENDYKKTKHYFDNLSSICDSDLSAKAQSEVNWADKNEDGFKIFRDISSKGIYSFWEAAYKGDEYSYELIALPKVELKMNDQPDDVQNFLKRFRFTNVKFKNTEEIIVPKYFECKENNTVRYFFYNLFKF
jgi:hypothetical protein